MSSCDRQIRIGAGGVAFALDYGAVMAFGAARAVDMSLLSDVLPTVEAAIVDALAPDDGGE